jgi:TldD protein
MIISSATGGLRAVQSQPFARRPPEIFAEPVHASYIALAEMAVDLAMRGGATYADIRLGQTEAEYLAGRENHIENCSWDLSLGFGLRVLLRGSWGFAASEKLTEAEIRRAAALALEKAEANARLQNRPIVLEDIPARQQTWVMPVKRDPFAVPLNEKTGLLLEINAAALKAGASYCRSNLYFAREDRLFVNSRGSRIEQSRIRTRPYFSVTAIDRQTGEFARRDSLAPPRAAGFEHVAACDLIAEAAVAAVQAREKLAAKPAQPGVCDAVIDGTNLYLTIHETVGHSTELDRALGWEADMAGTTFVTPECLDALQFGSPLMTIAAERTSEGGLSTIAFDDDGVESAGAEFFIVERGVFRNYQMAVGQARFIGRERSNGCAYADSPSSFPIQRMPNISLLPNPEPCSLDDLIGGVENGVYIVGDGSWSIDQQRDNFQFGGQIFYEIKDGKLGPMLRDAAYQDRTLRFWNSLDGLGDRSTHHLGGSFCCGKAQPLQIAPVSHGAPACRFRGVTIINTRHEDG